MIKPKQFFIDPSNGFLCYNFNKVDRREARDILKQKFYGDNMIVNSKTVYNEEHSRMAGIIGEIAFRRYLEFKGFQYEYVADNNVAHDFVVYKKNGPVRVDVKCKFRKVEPQRHHEASDFNYQNKRGFFENVDMYAFLSTNRDYEWVWFCGRSTKSQWVNNPNGRLWRAGEEDGTNEKVFHEDTWSVRYEHLPQFNSINV